MWQDRIILLQDELIVVQHFLCVVPRVLSRADPSAALPSVPCPSRAGGAVARSPSACRA